MAVVVALRSGVVVAIVLAALAFALKDVLPSREDPAPPVRLRVPDDAPGTLLATSEGDLYRIGAPSEPRVRLARGRGVQSPDWSPDATRIVFAKNSHIWVLDTRTRRATPLTTGRGEDAAPRWSQDARRIAFERTGPDGRREVWVMHADGTRERDLDAPGSQPAWSPDGSRLVFERESSIWTMAADGSRHRRLASPGSDPAWSPDGSRLVFERQGEIWIMNADGRGQRRVTPGSDPAWSPDAKRIAFAASEMIWTVNADGSRPAPVPASEGLEQPAWSPRLATAERRA
jgi:Tol biopolymer transport system component